MYPALFPGLCLSFVTCSNKRLLVFIQEIKAGINEAFLQSPTKLSSTDRSQFPLIQAFRVKGLELLGCWMVIKGKSAYYQKEERGRACIS